jgi:hypothetical protein
MLKAESDQDIVFERLAEVGEDGDLAQVGDQLKPYFDKLAEEEEKLKEGALTKDEPLV